MIIPQTGHEGKPLQAEQAEEAADLCDCVLVGCPYIEIEEREVHANDQECQKEQLRTMAIVPIFHPRSIARNQGADRVTTFLASRPL